MVGLGYEHGCLMLSSTYDILEIFDAAFNNSKFVGGILQIDCSGTTRYAEGEKGGVAWRIEADRINSAPSDAAQIKQGYAHMGEHLLTHFYEAAKEKAKQLGWAGSDIERIAETALLPVLSAMQFHMGMASDKGWLNASISMTDMNTMRTTTTPSPFTMEQAFKWSQIDCPKKWGSMELISMLISLKGHSHCLTEEMGQVWIQAHTPAHRQAAQDILNIPFAMDDSGRSKGYDAKEAVRAWKTWWLQVPFAHIGETPLSQLEKLEDSTRLEIVEAWYLAMAQSKKKSQRCMPGMESLFHDLPNARSWLIFSRMVRETIRAYTDVVWQNKEAQAWILNKCMPFDISLNNLVAMQNNPAHDYIAIRKTLDSTCKPHTFYSQWLQIKDNGIETLLDAEGLFEHSDFQVGAS